MVYIDWGQLPYIVGEYVGQNRNKLFHLIGNETSLRYNETSIVPMSHDGILIAIYDEASSEINMQMEEYLRACEGTNQGICYKAIKLDEKNGG